MRKSGQVYASKIVPVSPLKAFLGFSADFFISFGLMMLMIFFVAPLIQNAIGYDKAITNLANLASDSHLYYVNNTFSKVETSPYLYGGDYTGKIDKDGKISVAYGEFDKGYIGSYPFELYEDIIFDYYMNFSYKGRGSIIAPNGLVMTELKDKSVEEVGRYIGETIFRITYDDSSYYRFVTDEEGHYLYDQQPVLNENNATVIAYYGEKPLASASEFNNFYLASSSGVYINALKGFVSSEPLYRQYYAEADTIIFLAKIPTRLAPAFLLIFVLPLILRDGKSVGRLLCFTAVIDKNGYSAKKWRIAIHQGILFLPWLLGLLPYDVLALFSAVILYLADFLVNNVSPSKRSVHEIIAGTLTVNDVESSYFSSKEDLDSYLENNPEALEKEKVKQEKIEKELTERLAKQEAELTKKRQKKAPVEEKKTPEKAPSKELEEDDYLDGK